jgi:hypothetical protein
MADFRHNRDVTLIFNQYFHQSFQWFEQGYDNPLIRPYLDVIDVQLLATFRIFWGLLIDQHSG